HQHHKHLDIVRYKLFHEVHHAERDKITPGWKSDRVLALTREVRMKVLEQELKNSAAAKNAVELEEATKSDPFVALFWRIMEVIVSREELFAEYYALDEYNYHYGPPSKSNRIMEAHAQNAGLAKFRVQNALASMLPPEREIFDALTIQD